MVSKEEKLKFLYHYFIDERDRIDKSDGIFAEAGTGSECDGIFAQAGTGSDFDSIFPPHRGFTVVDAPALQSFNNFPGAHAEPLRLHRDVLQPMYGQVAPPAHHVPVWVAQGNTAPSDEITAFGAKLLKIANKFSSSEPSKSAIRFEKHCIYVSPKEQIVSIPIIRSDKCIDKTNKVTWETCDKSAYAGTHYVASSGEVTFELGETNKNIHIGILTSNDSSNDLRFTVKLSDLCGVFDPAPLTVVLKEVENFYPNEKSVFNNLDESQPYSVGDIISILSDCMNQRTFYMGLSYICSTTGTLDVQMALALELARLCRPKLREDIILNSLSGFFAQDDIKP